MKKASVLWYQSASRTPVNALAFDANASRLAVAQDYRKAGRPTLTIVSLEALDKPEIVVTGNQRAGSVSTVFFSEPNQLVYSVNDPDNNWRLVSSQTNDPVQSVSVDLPVSLTSPNLFLEGNKLLLILPDKLLIYGLTTLEKETTDIVLTKARLAVTDGKQIWQADEEHLWVTSLNGSGQMVVSTGLVLSQLRLSASCVWGVGEFGRGLFGWQKTGDSLPGNTLVNNLETIITAFAVSPNEQWIAYGNASGYVSLASIKTGKQLWGNRLHKGHVSAVTFSRNGSYIATGGSSGEVAMIYIDYE